ncbi:MAG: hypothetical protein IKK33_09615 [Lachnospiraceae bacterium]|nr:hypothetical protein [Lachnospiraceae bacterium]
MKKKLITALLLATTLFTFVACGTNNTTTGSNRNNTPDTKSVATDMDSPNSETLKGTDSNNLSGDLSLTAGDIKMKYANTTYDTAQTLYNMAEDQVFDFTFKTNLFDLTVSESDLVTFHTDISCSPESEVPTYFDIVEHEEGFTISYSPISAILETVYNEKDESENEHFVWGNAPVYYMAIHYDMETTEQTKLDSPQIIPFTIQHEVKAPEVRGAVDSNGCFSLTWEPVEGAEEYRIYNLVNDTHWAGSSNPPVNGAQSAFFNCSLMYLASTTDTSFADFDGRGENSIHIFKRSLNRNEYCIGQNLSVVGDYYVSAVIDGKESGFARAVETADLKIPYALTQECDIMFEDYETIEDLPLTLDVLNIDGSISKRNVNYTFQMEKTYLDGVLVPQYAFRVEGTLLTGCVDVINEPEGGYPEQIGEVSPTGTVVPENNISSQPDIDTYAPEESESLDVATVLEEQEKEVQKDMEEANQQPVPSLEEDYMVFADSAEEEWLALNMINGESSISVKAFPSLQNPDTLIDTFNKVYYQNPYIMSAARYSYDFDNKALNIEYVYPREESAQMCAQIYEEANSILAQTVTDSMSDEEKRLAIYKYLENNCTYDYEALAEAEKNNFIMTPEIKKKDAFNAYGIIVNKKGVCQSYALAYKLLCSMCDLECNVVTGHLNGNLPHAWNTVKIDDSWYQTDSTNNANVSSIPYFLYNSDSDTASKTGFTADKKYDLDHQLSDYESYNDEYEYYHSNGLYAEDLSAYLDILDNELEHKQDLICIRYDGQLPDSEDFNQSVVEIFYRRNLEDALDQISYQMTNNFIILREE